GGGIRSRERLVHRLVSTHAVLAVDTVRAVGPLRALWACRTLRTRLTLRTTIALRPALAVANVASTVDGGELDAGVGAVRAGRLGCRRDADAVVAVRTVRAGMSRLVPGDLRLLVGAVGHQVRRRQR